MSDVTKYPKDYAPSYVDYDFSKYNTVKYRAEYLEEMPRYVGAYKIGNLIFAMYQKPNWFRRFVAKLLLGWEWIDYDAV